MFYFHQYGKVSLHLAAEGGHDKVVELLLGAAATQVNKIDAVSDAIIIYGVLSKCVILLLK